MPLISYLALKASNLALTFGTNKDVVNTINDVVVEPPIIIAVAKAPVIIIVEAPTIADIIAPTGVDVEAAVMMIVELLE
jgi:hypothetical protein